MSTRRNLLLASLASYTSIGRTQDSPRVIGLLFPWKDSFARGFQEGIVGELRKIGYANPARLDISMRAADGDERRLPALAEDIMRRKPELIVAAGTNATTAARQASATVPIVFVFVSDPVRSGLVESLARPSRSMTGLTNYSGGELSQKRLALLYELLPGLTRLALLINPITNTGDAEERIRAWGATFGFKGIVARATTLPQIELAFRAIREFQAQAVLVQVDTFFVGVAKQIADLALLSRLPTVFDVLEHVRQGGLMSYGPDDDVAPRVAAYIDKILRGQQAGEIPVEQPTKVELAINRRTAESLGVKVPQVLLLQADRLVD